MNSDKTAAARQKKRYERLAAEGVKRKTLLVHDNCAQAFDTMKSLFSDAEYAAALEDAAKSILYKKPVNVASVRQLSPFRYPGGKTWLVPEIRKWLTSLDFRPTLFVEPFAGGGIASLTVAVENLAERVIMAELDPDVASVWQTILNNPDYLCERILSFHVTEKNVRQIINATPATVEARAFRTIIKNRTQRGGILAPGASLVKSGENGKGLKSRWYPETLVKRIQIIYAHREKIEFRETDAFDIFDQFKHNDNAAFFIDPPYTAGGKNAGKRLYLFSEVDHPKLFQKTAALAGEFMMTYNDTKEVQYLASLHGFIFKKVPMKNTHHSIIYELLVMKG